MVSLGWSGHDSEPWPFSSQVMWAWAHAVKVERAAWRRAWMPPLPRHHPALMSARSPSRRSPILIPRIGSDRPRADVAAVEVSPSRAPRNCNPAHPAAVVSRRRFWLAASTHERVMVFVDECDKLWRSTTCFKTRATSGERSSCLTTKTTSRGRLTPRRWRLVAGRHCCRR